MLPACLHALQGIAGGWPRTAAFISTALSLLLGFLVFYLAQDLSAIDALYLTIVTISTVGYGDISPTTPALRGFTVFYILIGTGAVFAQLANAFAGVLEAFTDWVKRLIDKFDPTDRWVDTTGDGKRDTEVTGRSAGMSGKAHDLTGDGHADFIGPPPALVFWAQELLPAMLLLLRVPGLVQLASASIFTALVPDLLFGPALYHCFITATTVGYGDVPLTTPEARLFACFHIVVSVSWLAALLSSVDTLRAKRAS